MQPDDPLGAIGESPATAAHGAPSRSKPMIAVVDDDPAILRALDRLIRSRGCVAEAFSSPAEFIESTAVALPDCLILDVQMPGMSGLELYHLLLERGCKFPVIFITAHEDPKAEAQVARAGAVGFFSKPFRTRVLWDAVLRALDTVPDRRADTGPI